MKGHYYITNSKRIVHKGTYEQKKFLPKTQRFANESNERISNKIDN